MASRSCAFSVRSWANSGSGVSAVASPRCPEGFHRARSAKHHVLAVLAGDGRVAMVALRVEPRAGHELPGDLQQLVPHHDFDGLQMLAFG
jgi:hypothetical protein